MSAVWEMSRQSPVLPQSKPMQSSPTKRSEIYSIRKAIWDHMEANDIAQFPRPGTRVLAILPGFASLYQHFFWPTFKSITGFLTSKAQMRRQRDLRLCRSSNQLNW